MPLSYATFTGNSGSPQHTFTIPYNYILKDHIKVYYGRDILANTQTALLVSGTDYNFTSDTTIQLIGSTLNSGTTTGNPHNLANGVVLTLERDTPDSSQIVEFADGSNLIGDNLNNANLQNLFVVQEQQDKNDLSAAKAISSENAANTATSNVATLTATQFKTDGSTPMTGDINANSNKIKNLADPTNAQDGVTKAYLERTGSITSTQIADGTIVNADVNASAAIAQSKLDIADATQSAAGYQSAADKTKLDGIETGATADQTDAEIRALVESASDSNVFTDQDHAKLNGIEAGATADQTNAEIRAAVEAAADSNVFTDNDHSKLNAIEAGATADQTATEIKTLYESNSNTNPLTDAEKAVIDGVTANTSELNKLDGFTGTVADLNEVVTGKNVVEQITGSATDAQIPTAQAVNERVVELVTEVGGFHPIANESSFPTSNPDINNGAGTIVSLKALTSSFSTGAGVTTHTFSNGTGAGNNVTINGLPSNTTFQAGKGLLLETTTTLHTYTYHRLVLDESGVSNADALVSAFNERYYGPLSSNPATRPSGANRLNGDLYFNSTDGKMKVYNGSHASGTWDDVAAPGNFFINTLSSSSNSGGGSATFNGTATRFTLSSPPNEAQQLLVSINGVIQKPNAGTSPSEGFAISGADIIFASAPPSGASYFIVTIGSSVNIGTPSDNTVTSAKIVDGSIVNGDISGSAAIAGSKISPTFTSNVEISNTYPSLTFTDTNHNSDYRITNNDGQLIIYDITNSAHRLNINADGHVDILGNLDVGAGLDVTGAITATGNLTISSTFPSIFLTDTDNNDDYSIQNQNGYFAIKDESDAINRLVIHPNGTTVISGNLTVDNGTSSTIRVEADSGGEALFLATGGANAQATAAIELMQSTNSLQGGGMSYNGDGTPAWASGESSDHITFYRRLNGARHEVFSYPFNNNNVTFNGNILPELDGTTDLGTNSTRFNRVYADNLFGKIQDTTFTSAVTIDVNGTDNGATTLLTLDNYISDIGTEYTWIDFTFRDSNDNAVPQVKIGAQAQDVGGGQIAEGTADFVVQCGVDNGAFTNIMTEMFRCSHDNKITSVHHEPQSNNTFDLGTSSNRWRNIFTNDLNLSNEGNANDVDGTWGSYTIQEGAEDLFLINKRNGKKYKFALTEVS